jgi:hypothetical protein
MHHSARLLVAAASSLIAPALASAQTPVAAADLREVQAYRLSMPKLKQLEQAYTDLAEADPRAQAKSRARKELVALQEKEQPTEADEARIAKLEAELEELEESEDAFSLEGTRTIEEMVRRIESHPRFASAVKRAGLAPRELVTMQLSLLQTMFAYGFLKAGTIKELPKDVSAENVKFVEQHEAEIQALTSGWAKAASQPLARP